MNCFVFFVRVDGVWGGWLLPLLGLVGGAPAKGWGLGLGETPRVARRGPSPPALPALRMRTSRGAGLFYHSPIRTALAARFRNDRASGSKTLGACAGRGSSAQHYLHEPQRWRLVPPAKQAHW